MCGRKGSFVMAQNHAADKRQTTRECIKKTFLAIYKKKPLQRIFVSDLVSACNISRGTFYFHYENIEQLYCECEQDLIDKMENGLNKVVLCTVGGSRKNMTQFIKTYSEHLSRYHEYEELFRCMLEGSEHSLFIRHWISSVYNHFQQVLPFSSTISPVQVQYLLHFFSGGEVHMLSNWVLGGFVEPAEEIAAVSAQVLFRGTYVPDSPDQ